MSVRRAEIWTVHALHKCTDNGDLWRHIRHLLVEMAVPFMPNYEPAPVYWVGAMQRLTLDSTRKES